MDESVFRLRLWQSVIAGIVLAVCALAASSAYDSTLVAQAVKNGADPIRARCGIVGFSNHNAPICNGLK